MTPSRPLASVLVVVLAMVLVAGCARSSQRNPASAPNTSGGSTGNPPGPAAPPLSPGTASPPPPASPSVPPIAAPQPLPSAPDASERERVAARLDAIAAMARRAASAVPGDHEDPLAVLATTGKDPSAILAWVRANTRPVGWGTYIGESVIEIVVHLITASEPPGGHK